MLYKSRIPTTGRNETRGPKKRPVTSRPMARSGPSMRTNEPTTNNDYCRTATQLTTGQRGGVSE